MRVLVVGAGMSGATIGNLLSKDNDVTMIDSSSDIGGNCHDHRDNNNIMIHDHGSHIFHTDDIEVWDYLSRYTEFNDYKHKVIADIGDITVPLPFDLDSVRIAFPSSADSIIDKLLKRYPRGSRIPLREFMEQDDSELKELSVFVYGKVFLHYTEKQWGMSPKDVGDDVLSRVPILIDYDCHYFRDRYQGIPVNGYTAMIKHMIDQKRIELRLDTSFKDVNEENYDMIFYTGSVDELMDYRYGILPYRSLRFEMEEHDMDHYQSNSVINYPNDHDYTRIHEYKYYLNDISKRTIIAKEYPEPFVPGRNRRFYPIRTKENVSLYEKYLEEAKKRYPNMYFLGRLGDYRYYDMDYSVRRAMDVYREVME